LECTGNEVVVEYFEVLLPNLFGGTDEESEFFIQNN
jgi:hypothetical protein